MDLASSTDLPGSDEETTLTIETLLTTDAAATCVRIASPSQVDTPVLAVDYFDAEADESIAEGVLTILPSWRLIDRTTLRRLHATAAARRAAGLAIRGGGQDEFLDTLGEQPQLPILRLRDGVSWTEFEAVVTRAIGEHAPGISATLLQPDYLYALADSVAEVFGGAVAIENHARTLLAYSTVPGQHIDELRFENIRTRQVPDSSRNYEQYREVLRADGPVRFPQFEDELARAGIAIRAGNLQLGSIWAIDPDCTDTQAPLPEAQHEVLERAARLAAGHLLASWRALDAESRRREQALARLLDGDAAGDELAALDLAPDAQLRLAALRFVGESGGPADQRQLHTFVDRQLRARVSVAAVALVRGTCYVATVGGTPERLRDALAATLRAAARAFTTPVRVSISSPLLAEDELTTARRETDSILRLQHDPKHPVRSSADVHAALFAQAIAAMLDEHPHLRHRALAAASDRRTRELRDTLLAWFEHGGASGAAQSLQVHENTVRYRVKQAVDEWQLQLDEPDEAFALWASLIAARSAD
ncbi:PucR family transcriptional regulator [Gulosibacter macacae]|uniref:PucR family transcriptional regulator n=1 Tax=Gulosibacter macacae TaxID=2488791 RepID=A0A3P3VVJ7_9MICO|nr:PucR family transcriptional regulator [Gulosibacter macacae]RRJ86821.1 PucR family transcriptional regulator [Gulosibacter macacae]